ncbi:hypothetical protein [Uliginosibacterium aquaticum]|uniref:Uncharacterized protein n=1 Tax=Uliginosibacterium aquaticum TaxID=2731212 RepID=A0ABX2IRL3_9RHOO|nr:hypothetical protein [Uliginosibacterium aquaticum]NSL56858.1 hypothetical protein [Uliginosibacterium aquaticum]
MKSSEASTLTELLDEDRLLDAVAPLLAAEEELLLDATDALLAARLEEDDDTASRLLSSLPPPQATMFRQTEEIIRIFARNTDSLDKDITNLSKI